MHYRFVFIILILELVAPLSLQAHEELPPDNCRFMVLDQYSKGKNLSFLEQYKRAISIRKNSRFGKNYFISSLESNYFTGNIFATKLSAKRLPSFWILPVKGNESVVRFCDNRYDTKTRVTLDEISPEIARELWGSVSRYSSDSESNVEYSIYAYLFGRGFVNCRLEVKFENNRLKKYRIEGANVNTLWRLTGEKNLPAKLKQALHLALTQQDYIKLDYVDKKNIELLISDTNKIPAKLFVPKEISNRAVNAVRRYKLLFDRALKRIPKGQRTSKGSTKLTFFDLCGKISELRYFKMLTNGKISAYVLADKQASSRMMEYSDCMKELAYLTSPETIQEITENLGFRFERSKNTRYLLIGKGTPYLKDDTGLIRMMIQDKHGANYIK